MTTVQTTRTLNGRLYALRLTLDEGQSRHFYAGRSIAVEKFDMRQGGTEFDFQVNSRAVRNGRPETIAAMRNGREREFQERRVKSNILGLPVSVGNAIAVAQGDPLELTYGELRPQVFDSRVDTTPVAWTIWFPRARYAGSAGRPRLSRPSGTDVSRTAAGAQANANASARIGAATSGEVQESGEIGPVGLVATLRIYIAHPDLRHFRRVETPFGQGDMIFSPPNIWNRVRSGLGMDR